MTGKHFAIAIDNNRYVKAKTFNALGNLPDLFIRVLARIGRIGFSDLAP